MLLLNRVLIRLSKGLWGWIALIALCKFLVLVETAHLSIVISGFLGDMLTPSVTFAVAGNAIARAFLICIVLFLLELVRGELEYRATAKARLVLRRTIFSKVVEMDFGHVEEFGPTKTVTAVIDGVEAMQNYYSQYLPSLIYSIVSPIYLFFLFKKISLPIALFLLVVALSLLPINNIFRSRIDALRRKYWVSLEDLTHYYLESIRGLTTFKLFERDDDRSSVLKQKADVFTGRILEFMKINFSSFLLTEGLMYGSIFISVIATGYSLSHGTIELRQALLVLMLSYSFFSSMKELMRATHAALAGVAAAGRVEDLIDWNTEHVCNPGIPVKEDAVCGIELRGVGHVYADSAQENETRYAVKDVSITCKKGQVTALVGPSGCGKSTLAGLMMRFFDPSEGHLYLNGHDYASLTVEELRRHLTMVPQSVTIFSGTLRENLLLGDENATDAELWEVLEEVRLADWARSQPEGLDWNVGDAGARLSGGQKQKIGIARALLRQAEYIILDEATSSIDRKSEEEIWALILSLAKKRTLIIISHRLSTIRNADRIYVLDRGALVGAGTHESLIAAGGLYAQLVNEQNRLENALLNEEEARA